MAGATVMEVATEVGSVKVEVHPTGQVRVRGSHSVMVLSAPRAECGPKHGEVHLATVVYSIPDRTMVELRRVSGPWFDKTPTLVARLDPDTGRGARIVVAADGGDRRGAGELGSAPVDKPESPDKLSSNTTRARRRRPKHPRAAKTKSSRDLTRGRRVDLCP